MIQKLETKEGDLLAKTQMLKEEFRSVGLEPTLLDNSDSLKNAIKSTTEEMKKQMISWREISETGDELPQIAAKWKLNAIQIKSGSNEMKIFKKNIDLYVSSLKNVFKNNSEAFKKIPGFQDTESKLDELKQKFDNGTISAEEFANEFDKLSNKMKTQMNSKLYLEI